MRFLLAAFLLMAPPAFGQVAPPPDPQIMIYRQLLDAANSQLAATAAALQAAQARIKELEEQQHQATAKNTENK
jgi:hypothetical protein